MLKFIYSFFQPVIGGVYKLRMHDDKNPYSNNDGLIKVIEIKQGYVKYQLCSINTDIFSSCEVFCFFLCYKRYEQP